MTRQTFIPRDYQELAIDTIWDRRKSGIFLGVGLGKSVCASWVISKSINELDIKRWIIVAPKRVCETTWRSEMQKWEHLDGISVMYLDSMPAKKRQGLLRESLKHDVTVVNYEGLAQVISAFRRNWPYDGVILDESSRFKDSNTKRFRLMRSTLPNIDRLIELTGSPNAQGYEGMWAQVFLLDEGESLGRTKSSFETEFFKPVSAENPYKRVLKAGAEDRIIELIRPKCITMRAIDHLPVVEPIVNIIKTPLPKKAMEEYQHLETNMALEVMESDEPITAVNAGVLVSKLQQVANGVPYLPTEYDDEGKPIRTSKVPKYTTLHSAKFEALQGFIDEMSGSPFLLLYHFQSEKDQIKRRFGKQGLEFFDGSEDQLARWGRKEIPILALHPQSGGDGVDGLQYGSVSVLWFAPPWSRYNYDQANGRLMGARQIGTEFEGQPGTINLLVAPGTADETALQTLKLRGARQDHFFAALRLRLKAASKRKPIPEITHDLLGF